MSPVSGGTRHPGRRLGRLQPSSPSSTASCRPLCSLQHVYGAGFSSRFVYVELELVQELVEGGCDRTR